MWPAAGAEGAEGVCAEIETAAVTRLGETEAVFFTSQAAAPTRMRFRQSEMANVALWFKARVLGCQCGPVLARQQYKARKEMEGDQEICGVAKWSNGSHQPASSDWSDGAESE